jgi:acetylornithine deacetylase/succinyl-diaminopimelate desuccinylase-like protein
LVALDTQNPPGNELLTARYLESALAGVAGVETRVLPVGEGRANFIARLGALRPKRRPVLVLGHMDVVGAQPEKWNSPPFAPVVREGYLYGRGSIDDKGMLAAATTVLLALADRRDELSRDVVLLATAGEEGGPAVGIDLVIDEHLELLGAPEFALNEGGRIRIENGAIRSVSIQTTEKIYYEVEAMATGPSGHGSVPLPNNALAALARAVGRVHEWRAPLNLNETTRLYFGRLAEIERDPDLRMAMLDLVGTDPRRSAAAGEILAHNPLHNAVMRTGQSLTLMSGGIRSNVIPSDGSATFNVRVMPGEDVRQVVAAMQTAAAESAVTFSLVGEPRTSPPVSPVDTALYRALEEASGAMAPEAVVMPFMSTGATDGAALRAVGIPTYGILPFPLEAEDELRMHGDNERVPVPALGWATEFIYRTLANAARP